jgi:type I restriction enzyme S subunit
MAEENKNPEVRFAGFTDDWEQLKVGELLIERNIQTAKSEEYPLMAFVAYAGVTAKGDRYNREFLVNDEVNKKYKQTEYGDFIYSSNNLVTGSIGLNNYGKASISPVYSIFQPTENNNSDFIGRILVRKKFINEMVRWRQGVVYGQWRIHETDFLRIEVKAPSVDEQIQIGTFFKYLDTHITFHQRKHEKLATIKKAMLDKMFPKKGDDVPEIRFKGFTETWVQRKYSETFTKIPNNTLSRAELNYNSGLAKNVHYGDVLIKFGELLDVAKDEIPYITDGALANNFRSSKLQSGDVIIADSAEDEAVGKCTELVNVGEETVISGLHTIPSRPMLSFVSGYLGYFMNSPAYHTQLLRLMQGTKVSSISKSALQDTAIIYPIDNVEQCKISMLFQQLNNLITLHQSELEKLKNVKKACFEKMFV